MSPHLFFEYPFEPITRLCYQKKATKARDLSFGNNKIDHSGSCAQKKRHRWVWKGALSLSLMHFKVKPLLVHQVIMVS